MPELLKSQVARVLDMLTKVSSPSRREVKRCLQRLRPYLLAAEATPEDIETFSEQVMQELTEQETLLNLECGPMVRETIERVMAEVLDLRMDDRGDLLSTSVAIDAITQPRRDNARRWCLKEFDNKYSSVPSHRPRMNDGSLPRGKRLTNLHRFDFRGDLPTDRHSHRLDRDDVERMLRRMGFGGDDFGLEGGGSPARL